jgi:hypothetical protein
MDLIGSSLCRLRKTVSRFIAPSPTLRDVRCLKSQIELRGLALRDIETIRRGLRPFTTRRQIGRNCRRRRYRHSCQIRVSRKRV